jgi:HEAT repeat protein
MGRPAHAALPRLMVATSDPHPDVRMAVSNAMPRFVPLTRDDVPRLAPLLTDGPPEKRTANIAALRALKPDPATAVALFEPLLRDSLQSIRREAIAALGDAGKTARPLVWPKLFPLLDDPHPDVRAAAGTAVAQLGPPAVADRDLLERGLRGVQPETRRYCAESLGALGPAAAQSAPFLARALSDRDPTVRAAAMSALGKVGGEVAGVLDEVLLVRNDADPAVRKSVIGVLRAAGRKPRVFEAMVEYLSDPDVGVRAAAIAALRGLKPLPGKDDILVFNTALKSDKADVRRYAAAELDRLGADSQPLLPMLLDAMRDPDPEVRKSVYGALGSIGPPAKLAIPVLLEELTAIVQNPASDPTAAERFHRAVLVLGQLGAAGQVTPLLRQGLKSSDAKLRLEALTAVETLGPEAKSFVPDLCALLANAQSRAAAGAALSRIGRPAAAELAHVIEKGPVEAKIGAIKALEQMKPEDTRDAATALYGAAQTSRYPEVRDAARQAMRKIARVTPKQ